jgi:hypothetical protein
MLVVSMLMGAGASAGAAAAPAGGGRGPKLRENTLRVWCCGSRDGGGSCASGVSGGSEILHANMLPGTQNPGVSWECHDLTSYCSFHAGALAFGPPNRVSAGQSSVATADSMTC